MKIYRRRRNICEHLLKRRESTFLILRSKYVGQIRLTTRRVAHYCVIKELLYVRVCVSLLEQYRRDISSILLAILKYSLHNIWNVLKETCFLFINRIKRNDYMDDNHSLTL